MNIAVFGTGIVGRTLAGRLAGLGNEVVVGTRDPQSTLARTQPDAMGNPSFSEWHAANEGVALVPYPEAASRAELVVNATAGSGALPALGAGGAANLSGKVILDVSNPLDFSGGFPPTLFVTNTDSLGEQIQRGFPSARVVKSLNTVNCRVMVDPGRVPGRHSMFVAGDDAEAKSVVRGLLASFGWPDDSVLDVGGIAAARGLEMYVPLWLTLMQVLGTADFNVNVVRG